MSECSEGGLFPAGNQQSLCSHCGASGLHKKRQELLVKVTTPKKKGALLLFTCPQPEFFLLPGVLGRDKHLQPTFETL